MRRSCWRLATLLVVALVGLVTLWSSDAAAQTITIGTPGRIRPVPGEDRPNPRQYPYRNVRPWWISYEDCLTNEVLVFPLTINNPRATLEVWAGTDACDERRGNTADRGNCWLLASQTATRDITVDIPVRSVVLQSLAATVPGPQPESVCEGSTDSDGTQITFYFFLQDGGKAVEGTRTTWTGGAQGTGFDLVGPAPPASLSVGMGESQLQVSLRGVTEDPELERIGAYCVPEGTGVTDGMEVPDDFEPAPPDAGVTDGGSSTDGDTTGGATELTPAPAACFTPLLVGGARPDFAGAAELGVDLSCGTANKSSGEVRTKPLENGRTYAIAVAGEDRLGNPGVLSAVRCGTPQELEDFFEAYKFHGGAGGGGFCAVRPGASRVGPAAALLALSLAAFGVRRARRRA